MTKYNQIALDYFMSRFLSHKGISLWTYCQVRGSSTFPCFIRALCVSNLLSDGMDNFYGSGARRRRRWCDVIRNPLLGGQSGLALLVDTYIHNLTVCAACVVVFEWTECMVWWLWCVYGPCSNMHNIRRNVHVFCVHFYLKMKMEWRK